MVSPITFLIQVKDELWKVTWPTQQEIVRLTLVVLVISAAVGLYIGGLDWVFTTITTSIIK